jgi:hypothetical protein
MYIGRAVGGVWGVWYWTGLVTFFARSGRNGTFFKFSGRGLVGFMRRGYKAVDLTRRAPACWLVFYCFVKENPQWTAIRSLAGLFFIMSRCAPASRWFLKSFLAGSRRAGPYIVSLAGFAQSSTYIFKTLWQRDIIQIRPSISPVVRQRADWLYRNFLIYNNFIKMYRRFLILAGSRRDGPCIVLRIYLKRYDNVTLLKKDRRFPPSCARAHSFNTAIEQLLFCER